MKKMETYLCQDVLGIIFEQLPYDLKHLFLVNKYIYNTFMKYKKTWCEGHYILTSIQQKIINDLNNHTTTPQDKSLIIQAQLSVGKTAAVLAFAFKCTETVVIMMPLSVMPQWYNEILKMYGQQAFEKIIILHNNYSKNNLIQKCRRSDYNPAQIGYKIIIISALTKVPPNAIMSHSLLIMDEVHTKSTGIYHPRFIGITASKAVAWVNGSHYHIYSEEEELPQLDVFHYIQETKDLTNTIYEVSLKTKGPYLIICDRLITSSLKLKYILYDRQYETLSKMNQLKETEYALLEPGRNAAGINLINIGCVIFIYPTEHINETVIQSLGRVQRVTSKNKNIMVYNIHKLQNDIYLYKTYLSENEIIQYCQEHHLTILKHIRYKWCLTHFIDNVLKRTTYDVLDQVPNIYYALILRISKRHYHYLYDKLSQYLHLSYDTIVICFNER
jgi:hypothetical protein